MLWHILDAGSIWLKEFAWALNSLVPTRNWCPQIRSLGFWENWEQVERLPDPQIDLTRFPLQRGYARFPVAQFFPFGKALAERIQRNCENPTSATLLCTAPFYAPVAEHWPGNVVYYLTDLTKEYDGMNARKIVDLDRRMCRVARTVCPNSIRIAQYLCDQARCEKSKVAVIPNATRSENLLNEPLRSPAPAPGEIADLPRPLVGVIGNLAANLDWQLITDAVNRAKDVSWVFVGPTEMKVSDPLQRRARSGLIRRGGRVRFVGSKPYRELSSYARSFDIAWMPYKKQEPTYSGSATRFYEHLAACRPILSSRGFHELLSKEPLLKLLDNGAEVAEEIEHLRANGFRDGLEEQRWRASREGTWHVRAQQLLAATLRPHQIKVA